MALTTLHLTAHEQEVFHGLSEELKDGWSVEPENRDIRDTNEKRLMRMHLLQLQDPKLTMLRDKALHTQSVEDLAMLIQSHDLEGVDTGDLNEIFFAIGPVVLTTLITYMLKNVQNDQDIEGIASLSYIRSLILSSQSAS